MLNRFLPRLFARTSQPTSHSTPLSVDPFPPDFPLGYFHSMQRMTGIPRPPRTTTGMFRLCKLEQVTTRGGFEGWVRRFDKRDAKEKEIAKEWREKVWNWQEVVGPVQAAKIVEEERERRNPFEGYGRKEGGKEGRGGAIPRASAPPYRPPPRRYNGFFRSTDPSKPLHARPFSSISTPIKFAPTVIRGYSTQTTARKNALRVKFPADTKVDLERIMKDFRDLELLELIKGVRPKSEFELHRHESSYIAV